MGNNDFLLLEQIRTPADLRQLAPEQLNDLAAELRAYLIHSLNICGGHFGANLGTVELTIALHYLFNTPDDRLIWDVGHQAYPHKILTGRREAIQTIKQPNGLAPFPKRAESEYDCFGTGHSSTSISAATGMAISAKMDNLDRHVVAIIGDGGLTGGMAFEALNHAGTLDANLLVILNDNNMSISNNVGALTHYFGRILSGKMYTSLRAGGKKVLAKMPPLSRLAKKTETHMKGMVTPGTLFEELGFSYYGPIDGHDIPTLLRALKNIREIKGANFLHVITTKGKGYQPAEESPIRYHAVKPGFYTQDQSDTKPAAKAPSAPTYSQVFGQFLCDLAEIDDKLVAITPAMCEGSGMVEFAKRFPQRFHDVGIAEQHSVTFAAGIACDNKKPVVAIYSTFLQRAYDQMVHDVCLQNLDVTFALDRAGLVGSDGPTHAGRFDLSFMRCIPNLVIAAPSDENECRQLLYTCYQHNGPAAVRYPRGQGPNATINTLMQAVKIGKGRVLHAGHHIAICAFGSMVTPALAAAKTLDITLVDMRFVKPLDESLIEALTQTHQTIVTVEENTVLGGAGSAVNEFIATLNCHVSLLNLGLPDHFIEHGNPAAMLASVGLDAAGITRSIKSHCSDLVFSAA